MTADEGILGVLEAVVLNLGDLLAHKENWNSLHITHEPPRVERLWCQHGDFRIFLHRIWPLTDEHANALYHPHPWPSAVRLVSGRYLHKIGTGGHRDEDGHSCVRVLCSQIITAGSSYAITDPSTWHSVEPIDGPSDSIMVVGKPYAVRPDMPAVSVPMDPLERERFDELFDRWRRRAGLLPRPPSKQYERAMRISRRLQAILDGKRYCKICGMGLFEAHGQTVCVHGHVAELGR